jgi:hypothetical protein
VAFNAPDSPFPAILPMLGQMGSFARPSASTSDVLDLYLHGYVSSRLMNLGRNPPDSDSDSAAAQGPTGLPISVAASIVDGLVLALTPNNHSYNYRSAVVFGHATLVTEPEEKEWAMRLITDGVVAGRWRQTRVPPNAAEMQSTSILRVKIASGSAKVRTGMPHDDRGDLSDEALLDRVWTGVVPVYQTFGAPVPGPYNRLDTAPAYLADYVNYGNEQSKEYAEGPALEEKVASKVGE